MKTKYKKVLISCAILTALQTGSVSAETRDTPIENGGDYTDININIDSQSDAQGIHISGVSDNKKMNVDLNDQTDEIKITSSSNVYGIESSDTTNDPAQITIKNGDLNLDLTGSTDGGHAVIGIWGTTQYNATPDEDDENYSGGYTRLNDVDTNINITTGKEGVGIIAGSDFGNNSVAGGYVVFNRGSNNITIQGNNIQNIDGEMARQIGVLAYDNGWVRFRNNTTNITINSGLDGESYHEVAGLYTGQTGRITADENSNFNINITGTGTAYGIASGFYDVVDMMQDKKAPSLINIEGTVNMVLDAKNAIGIEASIASPVNINTVNINFKEHNKGKYTGLQVTDGGQISIKNLKIGTEDFNDPTKITAITNDDVYAGKWGINTNAKININSDDNLVSQDGTVQINGKIWVDYKGIANINLSNDQSYIYGNITAPNINYSDSFSKINLAVSDGAVWKNIGNSRLTSLVLNNGGILDLTDKAFNKTTFEKINVKDFSGNNSSIHMDIDATKNTENSDRIYIDGTHTGTHYITLNNIGENIDGAEGTVLVSVNNEEGEFKANDSEGSLYWNRYSLDKKIDDVTDGYNTDWVLSKVEQVNRPTTTVETVFESNALSYHTWRAETDKLMKRMGDLRHNGKEQEGFWYRVYNSKISRNDEEAFENKYITYQVGYDKIEKETEKYRRYTGVAISYADGTSKYPNGTGDNSHLAVDFYSTDIRKSGHYLDLVAKVSDFRNSYDVIDNQNNHITGKSKNQAGSISAEYGRKKDIGKKWYIEPQTQLTLGYMGGDKYITSNNVLVDEGDIASLVGRLGFNFGRDIDEKTNFYIKANVLHEFLGDYSVKMLDTQTLTSMDKDESFKDTWYELGIGLAVQMSDRSNLYFDIEKSYGGDFAKDWVWNIGARWNF